MIGVATVAAGSFWGVEALFQYMAGVLATEVGYTGGTTPRPTYEEVSTGRSGHAEVVQIAFDPRRISYRELLERFWQSHDATRLRSKDQYRSAIFAHSPEQAAIARELKAELERSAGRPLITEIIPASRFYHAEEYHQHYLEKRGAVA